jgi:hypothetical protein
MSWRPLAPIVVIVVIFVLADTASAQRVRHAAVHRYHSLGAEDFCPGSEGFRAALGIRQYLNSFTSFQFPSPGTSLNPLSRLEWPWEQLFGVVKVGFAYRTLDLNIEYSSTISTLSRLRSQDSDWENEDNPGQKTTFSSSQAKPRGWTFDIGTTMRLPRFQRIRGVAGFRAQQFNFTSTGGSQGSIWDDMEGYVPTYDVPLPGPGIKFSQTYKHWYGGWVGAGDFYPAMLWRYLPSWTRIKVQGDFGYVKGSNHDEHLRRTDFLGRPQDRHTYETTTGHSCHLNLSADFRITSWIHVEVEGDFMIVKTRGSHHWTAWSDAVIDLFNSNMSWDGAAAWSEQKYVSVVAKCVF